MKLKKNDYQELRKSGLLAVEAKILELEKDQAQTQLLKMKNDLKNPRQTKINRNSLAKLKTIQTELKGALS